MAQETKLKAEQDVPMFEYNSAVKELVKISKAEKENLDHQIVLATSNLSQLRQEHIRLQGEFNQWKMGEEQKFKNELSKRHNQLVDQENKMNLLVKDLQQRQADLLVKEERFLMVEEERKKIMNDRIEVEKIRSNAYQVADEATRKLAEAHSSMNQASFRIEESVKLDNKNLIRNQELSAREDKIAFDLKNLDMERHHLSELKEFVEPKIAEIKELEDQVKRDKKETEKMHQEIMAQSEENKVVLKSLEDKKSKLDILERTLRSREDELKRNIIIAESKKSS